MPPVPFAHATYSLWVTDALTIVQKWAQVGCWPPNGMCRLDGEEVRAERKRKKG